MKKLIGASICGAVGGIIGVCFGIWANYAVTKEIKKELEAEKKEVALCKRQIFNFRYDLEEIGKYIEQGDYSYESKTDLYNHIKGLSDDTFEGLDYEHSAAGLEVV